MRHNWQWVAGFGLSFALLGPVAALAQTAPTNAVINRTQLALGVDNDASLDPAGTGNSNFFRPAPMGWRTRAPVLAGT